MGWVARTGMDYIGQDGKPKRVEAGERCDDVPKVSIGWLREQGHIEEVEEKAEPPADGGKG